MRVGYFQFFPPTIWTPGGGEVQLAKTREALCAQGVDVELFDLWNPRSDFDILHVFGSTYQLSDFVVTAKRLGLKTVVSPIIYTDKPRWQWVAGRLFDSISPLATIYSYRKRIYEAADILLPGSRAEAAQLHANFKVPWSKMEVVPVGVESRFLSVKPDTFRAKYGLTDFVLMVSRISRRKGQRRLIRALEGTGVPVVFIGQMDPDDPSYFREFQSDCRDYENVRYLGPMSHASEELGSAYAACRVHALPSVGEFPGIVSMEAGLAGAAVVAGESRPVREALGESAFYCQPMSLKSIRRVVLSAFEAERSASLRERLERGYVWSRIGMKIAEIYASLC
jgi:glycosyltransferase involved in cell wall biosynthesis